MLIVRLLSALLRALLATGARALSPPTCAACDASTPPAVVFCSSCARTVDRQGAGAPPVMAFASFCSALAVAIRRLKYKDRADLARPLGHLLRQAARDLDLHADLVVPVPLHPLRLAERGYNQAALLAAHVAAELHAPIAARALSRRRNTPQQARLARDVRLDNVAGAFHVREPTRVRGRAVVLIDDVATTGATLSACRDALLAAGAASVTCLVVGRTGDHAEADTP